MAFSNVPVGVYGNTEAAADLTGKLFYAAKIDANGKIAVATADAGGAIDGVITLDSPADRAARITFVGIEKVALGGTVTFAQDLAIDAAGKFVAATTGDVAVGRCLLGGAAGGIGSMLIYPKAQFTVPA